MSEVTIKHEEQMRYLLSHLGREVFIESYRASKDYPGFPKTTWTGYTRGKLIGLDPFRNVNIALTGLRRDPIELPRGPTNSPDSRKETKRDPITNTKPFVGIESYIHRIRIIDDVQYEDPTHAAKPGTYNPEDSGRKTAPSPNPPMMIYSLGEVIYEVGFNEKLVEPWAEGRCEQLFGIDVSKQDPLFGLTWLLQEQYQCDHEDASNSAKEIVSGFKQWYSTQTLLTPRQRNISQRSFGILEDLLEIQADDFTLKNIFWLTNKAIYFV